MMVEGKLDIIAQVAMAAKPTAASYKLSGRILGFNREHIRWDANYTMGERLSTCQAVEIK